MEEMEPTVNVVEVGEGEDPPQEDPQPPPPTTRDADTNTEGSEHVEASDDSSDTVSSSSSSQSEDSCSVSEGEEGSFDSDDDGTIESEVTSSDASSHTLDGEDDPPCVQMIHIHPATNKGLPNIFTLVSDSDGVTTPVQVPVQHTRMLTLGDGEQEALGAGVQEMELLLQIRDEVRELRNMLSKGTPPPAPSSDDGDGK